MIGLGGLAGGGTEEPPGAPKGKRPRVPLRECLASAARPMIVMPSTQPSRIVTEQIFWLSCCKPAKGIRQNQSRKRDEYGGNSEPRTGPPLTMTQPVKKSHCCAME